MVDATPPDELMAGIVILISIIIWALMKGNRR